MTDNARVTELIERLRGHARYLSGAPTIYSRARIVATLTEAADTLTALNGAEGWVRVPREPTEAMLTAGREADQSISLPVPRHPHIWSAMIAAAPRSA